MKKNPYPGKFIVFEGLDGSGLTTQATLFKSFLQKRKIKVLLTKEPTKDSSVAKRIKEILLQKEKIDPFEFQKLFAKDREEHLKKTVIPALKKGKWVISDRYFFSSFAFGARNQKEIEKIIKLNEKFLMPDIAIWIKVSPEICIERIKKRGEKIKLFERLEELKRVFKNYQVLKNKYFPDVLFEVDGEKTINKVKKEIINLVESKLKI